MKQKVLATALLVYLVFLLQKVGAQTPQVNAGGTVNGASFAGAQPLAAGVIFSLFGTSLTDGSTGFAASTPLPTQLAGARVLINGIAAPLFFASPLQINAQFPVELTGLSEVALQVQVQTSAGTATSPAARVAVASVSPGIFTWNQSGSGPGAILRNSDFRKICPSGRTDCVANLARRGEALAIYMTGLGAVNGTWTSGQPTEQAYSTLATPTVTIGGLQAEVLFSGLAAGFVGLYQVNVRVPLNAPTGESVPLKLTIGGQTSNEVTIAIVTPSPLLPGGIVRGFAIDPSSPDVLYAGTLGAGVFKSTNGGQSWTAANSGLTNLVISALAIDRATPATLYAGTVGGGVFKSTNSGTSWAAVNSGFPLISDVSIRPVVSALVVDPSNTSTLYAVIIADSQRDGVYKSTNGGASWTLANSGMNTDGILCLLIDPQNPSKLYAGTDEGLFRSVDGGGTWAAANSGLTTVKELENLGPVPAIISLALDPRNPATLYAGTLGGGVFRSTNGGQTWTEVNSGIPLMPIVKAPAAVTSLVVDPANPSTVYAGVYGGTSADGVYRSVNAGQSWTAVNSGLTATIITAMAIHPSNSSVVYAGSLGGVFKTSNGGQNWSAANSGLSAAIVLALASDPSNPSILYAATLNGLFKSTDGGQGWSESSVGIPNTFILSLAIDPSNPLIVYAGAGIPGGPGSTGVFKSTDGGLTWTRSSNGLSSEPLLSIATSLAIDASNSAVVYAGTPGGVFRSADGGGRWALVSSGMESIEFRPFRPYSDETVRPIIGLAADRSRPATVYASTPDKGIFKSANAGQSWVWLSDLTSTDTPWAFAVDPSNSATLYAMSTDRGFRKSTDSGRTWSQVGSINTKLSGPLAVDPVNANTVYAGTNDGILKSTDGGQVWTPSNSGLRANTHVADLAVDPRTPSTLYVATEDAGIFKSTDGGRTWAGINAGLPASPFVRALAIDPLNPTTVYAGTYLGVFKSSNGGQSWSASSSGLPSGTSIGALAIDPGTPATLYAGSYNGVFKSTNAGASWSAANSGLPAFSYVAALAVDPGNPATLYAATRYSGAPPFTGGVFKSTNRAQSWTAVNTGLQSTEVSALAIDPGNPATLYAATPDGVFKTTNGGTSWVLGTDLGASGLAVARSNPANVYLANSRGVFKSTDRGLSWSVVWQPLVIWGEEGEGIIYPLLVHPANPRTLFASVPGSGILRSTDGGASWLPANTGLPALLVDKGQTAIAVLSLIADSANPATIYAGTFGRGVFKSTDGGATWKPAGAN